MAEETRAGSDDALDLASAHGSDAFGIADSSPLIVTNHKRLID